MPRDSKNRNWHIGTPIENGAYLADSVLHCILATLMDIRDELQEMKELLRPLHRLNCSDFIRIPRKLDRIGRNTEPRKKSTKRKERT